MVWKPDKKTKKKDRNIQYGGVSYYSYATPVASNNYYSSVIQNFKRLPLQVQNTVLSKFIPEEEIRLKEILRSQYLTMKPIVSRRSQRSTRKRLKKQKRPRPTLPNMVEAKAQARMAAAARRAAAYQKQRFRKLCKEEFLSNVSDPVDISIVYEIADAINNNNEKIEGEKMTARARAMAQKIAKRQQFRNAAMKGQAPTKGELARKQRRDKKIEEAKMRRREQLNTRRQLAVGQPGTLMPSSAAAFGEVGTMQPLTSTLTPSIMPLSQLVSVRGKKKLKTKRKNKSTTSKKNSKKKVNDLKGGAYSEFMDVVRKIEVPDSLNTLTGNEIYKLFGLVHMISDMTHDNKLPIGEGSDCTVYNPEIDGCWNYPFNTLIGPNAGFPGFYKTYNTLIGKPFSMHGSEENLFDYSLKNSLFDKREFKIYPTYDEDNIRTGVTGGIDGKRSENASQLEFNNKELMNCIEYVKDSILSNHILTTDQGGMMSFIRSFESANNNAITENTLLQIFDSASGESVTNEKIKQDGNNLLFTNARSKFIELFQGCLDLPGVEISLNRAIPILSMESEEEYNYNFVNEAGTVGPKMPYFKMSLNKLSVSAGFGTIRGDADISGDDPAIQQHINFLNMSAMNVGFEANQVDEELGIQYKRKLSKLLKYMGDFLQVLSTNTPLAENGITPILYTGDRLCFIAGLLFKDPTNYPEGFPTNINEYLRTDTYYTGEGNNREMKRYDNYKTLYMSFRGTRQSGKAFKLNNYAQLVDEMSKTADPIVDVSIIVQHSKSVIAELSQDKLIEIINKLRGDVITFYNQIGNRVNIELLSELFLLTDGQIIPIELTPQRINMATVYQLNQVIQQQKDTVAVINAELLEQQKKEKASTDFRTLLDVFSEVVDTLVINTILKTDINSILEPDSNLEVVQKIELNNENIFIFKQLMELIVNNIKKDVTKKYIEKKINSAVNVANSYYEYYPQSAENPLLEKPSIIIMPGRSSGRYYQIKIVNSFAAILAYSNKEEFIQA